jgi:MFS family permease
MPDGGEQLVGTPSDREAHDSDQQALVAGTRATRVALLVVCLAVFLTALDQTVVVTALVNMINDLGVPTTALDRAAWIVSGYLLGYVVAMPLMGRIADVYGRRRVFAICLGIFGLGSLLCALAPTLGATEAPDTSTLGGAVVAPLYWLAQQVLAGAGRLGVDPAYPALNVLVAARFLQALGGGALVPVALAVVGDLFGGVRRGLALGLVGAVTEAGGVLGPVWGAWLTGTWGWQWIFWLNLPFVLLLALGTGSLPLRPRQREGVDLAGSALFGVALTCLTLGLGAQAGQTGGLDLTSHAAANPFLLAAAAVLLAGFAWLETRLRWPVIDPRLFRRVAFAAAATLSLLIGAALIVAMVDVPIFVLTVLNRTPIESGLALLRLTALIPIGALAGGWLSGRIGCRATAVTGCLLAGAGFWLMHLWPLDVDWTRITVAAVVAGLGFGLVIAPISTSALNVSGVQQSGSASAVITVLRMVGMILGLAALTAWGLGLFRSLVAGHPVPLPTSGESAVDYNAQLQAFTAHVIVPAAHQVYVDVFAVAAVLCVLGVAPALLLWRRPLGGGHEDAAPDFESYVAPLA